jgi:hypothetical protein
MKTRFPIIWIDDNEGFFDSLKDEVEFIIADHGLKADICYHSNVDGLLEKIPLCNPYIIVVDFKLGNGMTGDKFIMDLRRNGHFHDILFYTQEGFSKNDFNTFFDNPESPLTCGVNFCPKSTTKQRLEEIVTLKLNQVSDLPTQRGWIVADVIELECFLNELLVELSDSICAVFAGTIKRILDSPQRADFGCKATLLNGTLKDLIKQLQLGKTDQTIIDQLKGIKKIAGKFPPDIIEIRNSIAHQHHTIDGCGNIEIATRQRNSVPITYGQDFLKQVRENINKHSENFQHLRRIINYLRK